MVTFVTHTPITALAALLVELLELTPAGFAKLAETNGSIRLTCRCVLARSGGAVG
ncbi:MAG: hypothetical protein AAGA42_11890 [Actinomycetota bacterium]